MMQVYAQDIIIIIIIIIIFFFFYRVMIEVLSESDQPLGELQPYLENDHKSLSKSCPSLSHLGSFVEVYRASQARQIVVRAMVYFIKVYSRGERTACQGYYVISN
jgi:Na+/melibiose symporter-like transporter